MFTFSQHSLSNLKGVHPDLVKVANRAIQITPFDFGITAGLRTAEEEQAHIDADATDITDPELSKHLKQSDGFGHAFDFAVYVGGKVTWDIKYYRKVMQAMFTAAIELDVQIEAGGLWMKPVDGPHIQLNSKYYSHTY